MASGYGSYGDRRRLSLCLGGADQDLRADVPARPLARRPRRALDDAGDPRAAARSQAVQAPPRRPPGDREQPALRATARTRGGRDHPQAHAPSSRRRRGLRAHRGGRATARSTDRPRVVGTRSPCRRSHRPRDGPRRAHRAVPVGNPDQTPGSESPRDLRVPGRRRGVSFPAPARPVPAPFRPLADRPNGTDCLRSSDVHGPRAASADAVAGAQGWPRDDPHRVALVACRTLPRAGLHPPGASTSARLAAVAPGPSLTSQAIRLGFLPPTTIWHTSSVEAGQIYIPLVNWALFAVVVTLTLAFGSSPRLAGAYGVAVTGTFIITTILFLVVARARWHWALWKLALGTIVFLGLETTFFIANLPKVPHGGWITLLIAAIMFTLMRTWQRGSRIVAAKRARDEGSLQAFVED